MPTTDASVQHLEGIFTEGRLSQFLISSFPGATPSDFAARQGAMKDSDFILTYEDPASLPVMDRVREKVIEFFEGFGYEVDQPWDTTGEDSLTAVVYFDHSKLTERAFTLTITSHRQMPGAKEKSHLWGTAQRI